MRADGTEALDSIGAVMLLALQALVVRYRQCRGVIACIQDDVATAALLLNCAGVQQHIFPFLAL